MSAIYIIRIKIAVGITKEMFGGDYYESDTCKLEIH
jgi:hypothetical protein